MDSYDFAVSAPTAERGRMRKKRSWSKGAGLIVSGENAGVAATRAVASDCNADAIVTAELVSMPALGRMRNIRVDRAGANPLNGFSAGRAGPDCSGSASVDGLRPVISGLTKPDCRRIRNG